MGGHDGPSVRLGELDAKYLSATGLRTTKGGQDAIILKRESLIAERGRTRKWSSRLRSSSLLDNINHSRLDRFRDCSDLVDLFIMSSHHHIPNNAQ